METRGTPRRLIFDAARSVTIEKLEVSSPGDGEVLVRTEYSLMSTGTELIVFNRAFEPGTHWDSWVKYPFYPGYAAVGVIEALGGGVTELKAGDRVACRRSHASHHTVPASQCCRVPAALDPRKAAWFALAKIAFIGARAADYRLGDSVLVIGAGPIGQMSIRWAKAAGAEAIIAVDKFPKRLALATRGGATAVIGKGIDEAEGDIRAANAGKLPRVVIDGTGNQAVFSTALRLAADRGRVVILGDTGTPSGQRLTSDVIIRGLTIVGAHDGHNDEVWNNVTIPRMLFKLAISAQFDLEGLASHTFAPSDCRKAYETADKRREETMGILFDWSEG